MSHPRAEELRAVAERHGIGLLVQFGSSLGSRTHARSDVDVGAFFTQGSPPLDRQADLLRDLEVLFAGRDLDLALLNQADPLFLHRVMENCRLLAGSPRRLAELRLYAYRRYQDHRRFLSLERQHVRRFVAERLRS